MEPLRSSPLAKPPKSEGCRAASLLTRNDDAQGLSINHKAWGLVVALVGFSEPRSVFLGLPFEVRDTLRGYKEVLLVVADRFNVTIKHGDFTSDAVGILDRANALMQACRVRAFDMTGFSPNVCFEFGMAKGAGLKNTYVFRRKKAFGSEPVPAMMSNIDCPSYTNSKLSRKSLQKRLSDTSGPQTLLLPWKILTGSPSKFGS